MEQLKTKKLLFLREQDGPTERELKTKLLNCFSSDAEIVAAYLVRVSYAEVPSINVALCIEGSVKNAQPLVTAIGEAFRELFRETQKPDILFCL